MEGDSSLASPSSPLWVRGVSVAAGREGACLGVCCSILKLIEHLQGGKEGGSVYEVEEEEVLAGRRNTWFTFIVPNMVTLRQSLVVVTLLI